ncbi:MAG: glutamate racemase [Culicoidibacterales bacterium]
MNKPIGIIDSGFGGMSVVRALLVQQPMLDFVYLGDQARCPYGERTTEELTVFTTEMIHYLVEHYQVQAIVIACNTISANCLPEIRARFMIPIISIVECGIELVQQYDYQQLAIIATTKTINSHMYQNALDSYNCFALATPPFALYVETQQYDESNISQVLQPLKGECIQAILLGCTHYPFLSESIQNVLPGCVLLDPALTVREHLPTNVTKSGYQRILTTGSVTHFQQLLTKLVPEFMFNVEHVELH